MFFLSICKILEDSYLFCYCFKAGRASCATPAIGTVQVCCYSRSCLWRDALPLGAGRRRCLSPPAHAIVRPAVISKGLTASQRWCCHPPGLPARCTVVVSDQGGLKEAVLAPAAASVSLSFWVSAPKQHGWRSREKGMTETHAGNESVSFPSLPHPENARPLRKSPHFLRKLTACRERVPLGRGAEQNPVWQTTLVLTVMVKTMQVNPTALCPTSLLL